MANTFLREAVSANGNKKKWTISAWVKRSGLGANTIMSAWYADSISGHMNFGFDSNDRLDLSTWSVNVLTTNRKFRDTNAWYHIQVAVDTDESTANNRARFYVNGVEETSFSTRNNKSSGFEYSVNNSSSSHNIGGNLYSGTTNLFNGSMSHFHFIDGQQYAPTVFGSTDTTTGEWKINTSPSATYGTNGFFILKDGNSVTDQSGKGNNLTVQAGTFTKTEDSPSNVFATINPLANAVVAPVGLTQGNNTVTMSTSRGGIFSTLSCTGGKYYAEMKIATMPTDSRFNIGILPKPITIADDPNTTGNDAIVLSGYNAVIYANSGSGTGVLNNFYGNATGRFSGTPILGCAVDLESATRTMAISINGAWVTGSNATSTDFSNALKVDISTPVALEDNWFFACGSSNSSGTMGVYNWNYGNGYFGTTAVSSAGTNASGIGIFEYDVPTGFTALSTKGLNL